MKKVQAPIHVAFIMDGNGRWAKARHLPRHLGHKAGCDRVTDIYEESMVQGVKVMSLYAFSTENWNRPKAEINHLFSYLEIFFKKEIKRMLMDGCRIIASGDLSKLPLKTQKVVNDAIEQTKDGKNFTFNICLNFLRLFSPLDKLGKREKKLIISSLDKFSLNKDSVKKFDISFH